ncbi:MAG: SDR family NAD(P)-dependent oxidoreductase, partial [Bdellovibrionota bacterium]
MDLGISGKVILITGAGSGIGRRTAEVLASEGAVMALADVNQKGLADTEAAIKGKGGKAASFPLDVTSHTACETIVQKVVKEVGPLYGLCNVAGVLVGTPFQESSPENWEAELNVCLKGTMNLSHAAIPELTKLEYAKIVNVASDAARIGEKTMVAYSAAKGGVVSFTKS